MRKSIVQRRAPWIMAALACAALAAGTELGAQVTRGVTPLAAKKDVEPVRAPADSSRKVALIIGNANYKRHPLANPEADARAMYDTLGKLGFKMITVPGKSGPLTNAEKATMVRALAEFETLSRGAGVRLFYFAGHGIQMDGRNYLLPVDVNMDQEIEVKHNAVNLDLVLETLGETGLRRKDGEQQGVVNIVILDACRNNPFERGRGGTGGLAAANAPAGTIIAYATSPGRVALDGRPGEKNGLYTKHLLQALQLPGANIVEVFMVTRDGVMKESDGKQLPWETMSMTGQKLFVLRPGAPAGGTGTAVASADSTTVAAVRGFDNRERPKQLAAGAAFKDCERCPEMVVVPGRTFEMGSPAGERDRHESEGPQHKVTIARPFAIGRFEVTFAEWEACLLDGGCDHWPADRGWGRGNRPVIDVSWEDADRYVRWLARRTKHAYRLLSEAEWEYVARAGTVAAPAADRTLPVNDGTLRPNEFGVVGMLGNVWEWVADCSRSNYAAPDVPTDGSAWEMGNCALRGLRGGSFTTAPRGMRPAARSFFPAQRRDVNIGFRVATVID